MSTLAAILHKDPEPLSEQVPPAFRMIVEKALEKNPPDRYQSMSEMVVDLRRLIKRPHAIAAEATRRPRGRFLIWVGIIALAVTGAWMIKRPSPAPQNPLASARFTRLTDFDGAENGATISPNGEFVVFRSDRDGQFDLFMTQIGTGRFVNLTQGKVNVLRGPVRSVGFGADGTEIWLMGSTKDVGRLELMPLFGGPLRPFLSDRVVNIAWSPDGSRLAYHTFDTGDPMFLADRTGANPKQIFRNPAPGGHNHYPIFSPDGRWLYFVSGIWTTFEMDLWRVPATGGTPERLTHHSSDVTYPTPIDNETILYVSPAEDGSGPWLWAFDVNQRTSRRVSFGLEKYFSLAASADGRRVVATVANPTASLWSMPILESVVGEGGVKPYPLPTVRALAPRFNGESLLYLSSSGAGDGLWRYEKGQAREIWKGANESLLDPPGVSPDGRRATLVLKRESKRRLHLISVDGAELQALAESIDVRGSAGWSPDGKWIITGGNDRKGPGLFKIPVEGGDPVRLVSAPGLNPVWSPAGDLILYTGSPGALWVPMLAVRPDGTSVELPEIRLRQDLMAERLRFLPDGKRLVYMQGSNPWQDFWMLDLTTKKTRQLSRLDNRAAMRTFDITPDGKQIVFDRLRENSDVVLIDLAR